LNRIRILRSYGTLKKRTPMTNKIFLTMTCAIALTILFPPSAHADGELLPGVGLIVGATAGGIIGDQFGHGMGRDVAGAVGLVAGGAIGYGAGYALKEGAPYWSGSPAGPRLYHPGSGPGAYAPNYVAPGD
jgi:hypothetical protein